MVKKSSGKLRRFKDKDFNLDLTYITDRIVAMSFPASKTLEKLYRNNISDVARFFDERHPNKYLICNVSNREIDIAKFHNQVIAYPWSDDSAPSLLNLF